MISKEASLSKILEALAVSVPRSAAAKAVGISGRTLNRWMEEDASIKEKVDKAEAQAIAELYRNLHYMSSTQNFAALNKLIDLQSSKNEEIITSIISILEKALPEEYYMLALKAIKESDL